MAMKLFSEGDEHINAECPECGRVIVIKRLQAVPSPSGFDLNPPAGVKCMCGAIHHAVMRTATGQGGMVCPHCQTRGSVTTKKVKKKSGISGGKATGAVLTLGVSMLATGLSRKQKMTEAHCSACGAKWHF